MTLASPEWRVRCACGTCRLRALPGGSLRRLRWGPGDSVWLLGTGMDEGSEGQGTVYGALREDAQV